MATQALGTSHTSPPRAYDTYKGKGGLVLPHKVGHIFWDGNTAQEAPVHISFLPSQPHIKDVDRREEFWKPSLRKMTIE